MIGPGRRRLAIPMRLGLSTPQFSPITRAALWILLSGICSVMMNVLIRIAAQEMHPFEVAFFRCLFGLLFVLPWIVDRQGRGSSAASPQNGLLPAAGGDRPSIDGDLVLRDHRGAAGDSDRRRLYRPALCDPG